MAKKVGEKTRRVNASLAKAAKGFDELKRALMEASFTAKQWKELSALCEIRQGNFTAKQTVESQHDFDPGTEHVRLFYERLKTYLLDKKLCSVAPLNVLQQSQPQQYSQVKKLAGQLAECASEWNTDNTRQRNFSIGIYHLYVQLVVEYLQGARVPISVKAVLQHGDKFAGLVDRAYPDYIKAGLMPLIVFGNQRPT